MKKSLAPPIFFFLILLSNQGICQQQWNPVANSTSDVYLSPISGKVGVGTDIPTAPLHLVRSGLGDNSSSPNTTGLLLQNTSSVSGGYYTNLQASPPIVLSGNMWNYVTNPTSPYAQLIQFKIDATAAPAHYNNDLSKTFASFRVQRGIPTLVNGTMTYPYSDFFTVDALSNLSLSDNAVNLSLVGTKVIGYSSSGVKLFSHASQGTGSLNFCNNDGTVTYGFISNASNQEILNSSGQGTGVYKNVAGTMVLGTGGKIRDVNPFAMLDIVANDNPAVNAKGVLMPRMNTARMNAITGTNRETYYAQEQVPLAKGLQVYNTEVNAPYYYNGRRWTGNPNVIYVSPLEFGANFDDMQPDDEALEKTYNYCRTLPDDKQVIIQMPPGICYITEPWVIGARGPNEGDCFTEPSTAPYSGNRPVSIEGSGATAIYMNFSDPSTYQAGIYYTGYAGASKLDLFPYHISGIGFYRAGYFSTNPPVPYSSYDQVNNKQIGILCLYNTFVTIENCTFRDLGVGVILNNAYFSNVKNCNFQSCRRGFYSWRGHGSMLENISMANTELAFEMRSGQVIATNLNTTDCPTSLWVKPGGAMTFNGCYFHCVGKALDGAAQVIIGEEPGDEYYDRNKLRDGYWVDAINFNSLTIVATKTGGVAGVSLWMKESAKRVSITGGYLESSLKNLTETKKLLDAVTVQTPTGPKDYPEVWTDNQLVLQHVNGHFTSAYGQNLEGKISIQNINSTFQSVSSNNIYLPNQAITPTPTANCYRPLCLDKFGKIVLCPSTGTTTTDPLPSICVPTP
ncbi:MAG: right-handed parallel beta-helix repeat-containing protein [Bacteroidota bacterium]